MFSLRSHTRSLSPIVLFAFLTLSLHAPLAGAGLIGTDTIVNAAEANAARDTLRSTLDRADVRQALLAQGASPDEIHARVAALTDAEAQTLAANMEQLPAGGDALALAVFVFLVLLLTDILGYTDIFPFVKKPARH
jgi:hypothetical protein